MSSKKSSSKKSTRTTKTGGAEHRPAKRKRIVTLAEYEAGATTPARGADAGPCGDKTAKSAARATVAAGGDTGERDATAAKRQAKAMSLLDAAAHLLSLGAGDAMRCKDIVDLAVQRGLWAPRTGKTPAATLYAAILREIKLKGDASRFVKTERGKFALRPKA